MKSLGSSSKSFLTCPNLPPHSYRPFVLAAAATADPVDIAANSTIILICLGATHVVSDYKSPPVADAVAIDDIDYNNNDFHGQEIAIDEPHS